MGRQKVWLWAISSSTVNLADGFWLTNNCIFNGDTATGFFVDGVRTLDNQHRRFSHSTDHR